ncbi:MAG: hypothetical protein WDW36_006991 [Sanguina aurantia]
MGCASADLALRSESCNVKQFQSANLDSNSTYVGDETFTGSFHKQVTVWLPVTAVIGLLGSVLYLYLFRRFAQPSQPLPPGGFQAGIITLVLALIMSAVYFFVRRDLPAVAALLSVAGRGLQENPWTIPYIIGVKVVGAAALVYLFAGFVMALSVGSITKTTEQGQVRYYNGTGDSDPQGRCYLPSSNNTMTSCCSWEPEGWAVGYMVVCWITMIWTSFFVYELKLYVVADTMAQWYFMPNGAGGLTGGVQPSVRRALRNAMTSHFGSLAFGSVILTAISILRSMLQRASTQNVFCCLLNCIIQPILALCEQFTKFATIAVAVTGKSFVDASKQVFGVLSRCMLQTYSLWWIPEMVLWTAMAMFAFTWACLVFFVTYLATRHLADDTRLSVSFATAGVCLVLIFFVLGFIASMLLDICNTIYICFAIDRDSNTITKPEVHEIYMKVPSVMGSLVQQPGGDIVYGAPQAQPTYGAYQGQAQMGYPAQQQQQQQQQYGQNYNAPHVTHGYSQNV